MKRKEIEDLKEKVGCDLLLEKTGFSIDVKESTRRAMKFRRGGEIIIVTHEGKGWFDPLSDDKGDIFSLVERLEHVGFAEGFERVASLVGYQTSLPIFQRQKKVHSFRPGIADRWHVRHRPWRGSAAWRYLSRERALPSAILNGARSADLLREGPCGSMWAAHTDETGAVCGWEERGPEWRGFSTGGAKRLFRFGPADASRLCVTEAAIDAMSLAAIEGARPGTLYLSTGGGWSPLTDHALRALAARPDVCLVAATDANPQGETYAERLRALAEEAGCGWQRLRPPAHEDWNDLLRQTEREREKRKKEREGVPHSRRPRQGKLRPAEAGP